MERVVPASSGARWDVDFTAELYGTEEDSEREVQSRRGKVGAGDLPLHMPPVQFATLMSLPWQGRPPWLGGGSSHVLLLVCVQSLPHTDHADHLDHPPSTTDEGRRETKRKRSRRDTRIKNCGLSHAVVAELTTGSCDRTTTTTATSATRRREESSTSGERARNSHESPRSRCGRPYLSIQVYVYRRAVGSQRRRLFPRPHN